jgi:hypothetical protein
VHLDTDRTGHTGCRNFPQCNSNFAKQTLKLKTARGSRVARGAGGLLVSGVKKPTEEQRRRMCTGKRRYPTQGDALEAAAVAGVERWRSAYLCPICRKWHLTSR